MVPEGPERGAMSFRFLDGLGYRAGKSDTPRFGATVEALLNLDHQFD